MKKQSLYIIIGIVIIFALGILVGKIDFERPVKQLATVPVQSAVETAPVAQVAPVAEPEAVEPEAVQPVQAPPVTKTVEVQKGICYIAWTEKGYSNVNSAKSMEQLSGLGVNWVSLSPLWFQNAYDSTDIYPLKQKTASDESLIFAIEKFHSLNIKVMLKPHLDVIDVDGGRWRGDISFPNQADWQAWFENYTEFILHYARLAQQRGVQMFCVGTELSNASVNQPQLWRELIKQVREVYKGCLTYAANWHEEFDYIEFWDQLDYAAIDPYFPLVSSDKPTKEQLVEVWKGWFQMVENWQKQIDKPVIFAEAGYKSAVGATDEPWKHSPPGPVDLQLQADCYQALLETFYEQPWFYGVYWWYWGVNPKMGGELHRGFTPQNKPAQEVIRQWYSKPVGEKQY
ncbi:hypothetical protein ACFL1I_00070 [Candidatus Omnitrophota bacterium]